MNFYHNDSRSGYEEVKSYYPVWYPCIKEMDAVFRLTGAFLDCMASDMEQTACNSFVMEMEERVIDRLLKYFGVRIEAGMVQEEKRSLLAALYDGNGKISASQIKGWIKIFCGQNIESEVEFTNRLKVVVHLKTIEDLVGSNVYEFLMEKIPAHLMLALYGRYSLKYGVLIHYDNAIRFSSVFHPRYNLPYLHLDQTWRLDRGRKLSGYDSGDVLDFYPVRYCVQTGVRVQICTAERARVACAAENHVEMKNRICLQAEAKEEIESRQLINLRTGVGCQLKTAGYMTKRNLIDAAWRLDGSRKLDGGRYDL